MTSMEVKTKEDIEKIFYMVLFEEHDPLEAPSDNEEEEQADAVPVGDQEEFFRKRCGKVLAELGDKFLKEKSRGQPEQAQLSIVERVKSTLSEAEDWERFKEVIDSATEGCVGDSYKTLGTLVLVLRGLRSLGKGTKMLAAKYANKYVSQAKLDSDIVRMGGLTQFLAKDLE